MYDNLLLQIKVTLFGVEIQWNIKSLKIYFLCYSITELANSEIKQCSHQSHYKCLKCVKYFIVLLSVTYLYANVLQDTPVSHLAIS